MFTISVYNLQVFEAKNKSTRIPENNCKFYNEYQVKSTIYIRLPIPPPSPSPFRSSSIFQVVGLGQLPRLPETAEIVITSGVVVVFYSNYNTTPTKIMPINLQHFTRFSLKSTNSVDKKKYIFFFYLPPYLNVF